MQSRISIKMNMEARIYSSRSNVYCKKRVACFFWSNVCAKKYWSISSFLDNLHSNSSLLSFGTDLQWERGRTRKLQWQCRKSLQCLLRGRQKLKRESWWRGGGGRRPDSTRNSNSCNCKWELWGQRQEQQRDQQQLWAGCRAAQNREHLWTSLHKWTRWQEGKGWWGELFELQCCMQARGRQESRRERRPHRRSTWIRALFGWSLQVRRQEQKPRWWPTGWTPGHTPFWRRPILCSSGRSSKRSLLYCHQLHHRFVVVGWFSWFSLTSWFWKFSQFVLCFQVPTCSLSLTGKSWKVAQIYLVWNSEEKRKWW